MKQLLVNKRICALAAAATILLFAFAAFATAVSQEKIGEYTEPGEQATLSTISVESGTYTLATVDGTELLLFEESTQKLVTDFNKIHSIFKEEYYKSIDYDARIEAIKANMTVFNASRQPDEAQCKQYTGTDRWPCTDKNSCLFACRSVPICLSAASTEEFISEIKSMVDTTAAMNNNVSILLDNVNSVKESTSALDAEIARINDVKAEINTLKNNKLMSTCGQCYNFCKPINFNVNALNSVLNELNSLKTQFNQFTQVESRARLLADAAQERLDYLEARGKRFQGLTYAVNIALNDLRGRKITLEQQISEPTVETGIQELENVSTQMTLLGNSKRYSQAFELEEEFFSNADNANNTMNFWLDESKQLKKLKDDAKRVLERLDELLTEDDSLRANLTRLTDDYDYAEKQAKAPVNSSKVNALKEKFKGITEDGEKLITAKVLSGTPTGKNGGKTSNVTVYIEQATEIIKKTGLCPTSTGAIVLLAAFALTRKK